MPLKIARRSDVRDRREEDLSNTILRLHSRQDYIEEITRLWGEANDKFLAIGRYLIQAKQTLPHGEYQPMIARDLPFKPVTARMIVTATQAIEGGTFPAERLPPSYTTVYLLTTLSEEERAEAERTGLIRPDVRRAEVQAFKRTLSASRGSEEERLRAERERLLEQERRIMARLAEIEEQIGGTVLDLEAEEVED